MAPLARRLVKDAPRPRFLIPLPWATDPAAMMVREESFMLRLALNEAGTAYYTVIRAGSEPPSSFQVRARGLWMPRAAVCNRTACSLLPLLNEAHDLAYFQG